ncbi:Histidine protein methyltransferase 1 [Podochytrium sp. JEL0797]|nr:Histidine protein methyltransferase 1 [Podochytrium sp. JEL0797]
MSFRFNFGNDEPEAAAVTPSTQQVVPSRRIDPPSLTQQSVILGECIRLSNGSILYRRCLADVKMDAASLDAMDGNKANEQWIETVMLENTDLIDGVYEGGFKTWECSVDLASYLAEVPEVEFLEKRVLELGCGSALPGLYCLAKGAHVDFQDYNDLVIQLVTMPNTLVNSFSRPEPSAIDEKGLFEVEIDAHAIHNLKAGFYSGDWGSLNASGTDHYDLILTSETIYSTDSHQKLHDVIKRSLKRDGRALIAAKRTYFGCSGDLEQFLTLVAQQGVFKTQMMREFNDGVYRVIVQLSFK